MWFDKNYELSNEIHKFDFIKLIFKVHTMAYILKKIDIFSGAYTVIACVTWCLYSLSVLNYLNAILAQSRWRHRVDLRAA